MIPMILDPSPIHVQLAPPASAESLAWMATVEYNGRINQGDEVQFNDGQEPRCLGAVTRVWPNGRYVTVISDGRTFVRCVESVVSCG